MKNLMNKIRKANKGFTLVELIIVIAIIAVLTAVAAPQYIKYVEKGRVSADMQMAETLLSEVNVALAEAGSNGTSVGTGAITVTATACTATGSIGTTLDAIDAKWDDVRVTNKAGSPGTTYKIEYTADKVTSAGWSSPAGG